MSLNPLKYSTPVFKKDQPDDTYKFRPLPLPTGHYPYHLNLNEVNPLHGSEKLIFHMVGDTGSIRNPGFQHQVSREMARQYAEAATAEDMPRFLFHLGDIVYTYGEAENYPTQFFGPYQHYPGPVFAIPGNHDGDVNPDSKVQYDSLDPFTAVFCDSISRPVLFSGSAKRKSMVQPNVFWTLETPLANIIGLYSNVPKYGVITREQRAWLIDELKAADIERPEKAVIVCLHHAPFSADINHGSSRPMIEFLEGVFSETGIRPDIVFSGHVHNYQRFEKRYPDGTILPYIVAGGGGYDELHSLALIEDEKYSSDCSLFEGVSLQNYCDDLHGFLKVILEKTPDGIRLTVEFYAIPHDEETGRVSTAIKRDSFSMVCKQDQEH